MPNYFNVVKITYIKLYNELILRLNWRSVFEQVDLPELKSNECDALSTPKIVNIDQRAARDSKHTRHKSAI